MWPFKKARTPAEHTLPFKSGLGFFKVQCQFGETDIVSKRGIIALVEDARDAIGADEPTRRTSSGTQICAIRVAAPDGGFLTIAETASPGPDLRPGDVVIWVPIAHSLENPAAVLDERMGWFGLIAAKIAPEIDTTKNGFSVLHRYA